MVLLVALTLLAQPQTDRARALELYRAKRYAEACPLFERVARAAPKDAEAWNDYALCLIRGAALPVEPALPAIVSAWTVSKAGSRQRAAALFNFGLYFERTGSGVARLGDVACRSRFVTLTGSSQMHFASPRSYGQSKAMSLSSGGAEEATELGLGGDVDGVDALPMPHCYPERIDESACEALQRANKNVRTVAERARKEDGDDAVCGAVQSDFPEAFERRVAALNAECNREVDETRNSLKEEVAAVPRCRLLEVDVCSGRARARCGKSELTFTIGEAVELPSP